MERPSAKIPGTIVERKALESKGKVWAHVLKIECIGGCYDVMCTETEYNAHKQGDPVIAHCRLELNGFNVRLVSDKIEKVTTKAA